MQKAQPPTSGETQSPTRLETHTETHTGAYTGLQAASSWPGAASCDRVNRLTSTLIAVSSIAVLVLVTGCDSSPRNSSSEVSAADASGASRVSAVSPPVRESPQDVATQFVDRWSRRGLVYSQWWAGLRPLCSPRCREDFAFTDPAGIPSLNRNGASRVARIENGVYAVVQVPTSRGTFQVALTRPEGGTWQVSTMTFPPGFGA